MKLPDFGAFEPFLDLKKRMDARAPVTFSAEFSARQISNDNFAAQEAVAMPQLEDFVTPRAKRPESLPLPQATPSEEPAAATIVLPQPTRITEPEKTAADPVITSQPQSRAKLRPARHDKQKKSVYHRRSILTLTLAAGGILLLNAALLWVFFSYLATITKPVSNESPPVIAQPQPVSPPPQNLEEVAPKPAPAAPQPPMVLAPPPPAPEPQQAQPEPLPEPWQPAPAEPVQALPAQEPQGVPPTPQVAEPHTPATSQTTPLDAASLPPPPQEAAPPYPEQQFPRPSIFDGQPPSNLSSGGGIGGVGAGWGGQGGSAGLAGQGGVGGIGGVGAPGVGSGQAATPPANLRFRRVYVRHYVRVPPPPPEDIPADQLPWKKP